MSNRVIYEENDLMRALLEEWLGEAGYRVLAAASHDLHGGTLADLVIVSVYMPKQGGARLVREIQALYPGTPLIAISRAALPERHYPELGRGWTSQTAVLRPSHVGSSTLASKRHCPYIPSSQEQPASADPTRSQHRVPAGAAFGDDQRALDAVCLAKMIVSTSLLRNNTRPLGVR